MRRTAKEMNKIIGGWLEESKRPNKDLVESSSNRDFMDSKLSSLNGSEIGRSDAGTIAKATCLVLFHFSPSRAMHACSFFPGKVALIGAEGGVYDFRLSYRST